MTSKGEWVVGDTLDTDDLNNEDYKSKYQQQLQAGRRKWLEEYQVDIQALTKNLFDVKDEKERDAQYSRQQIEQKDRELQEKERELQGKDRELQEKEREEAEKELEVQRYVHQLQEKERQNTESKLTQLTS